MNYEFLPVLLGTDSNVYGMARSFHEEYGIVSVSFGAGNLVETQNSKIVNVNTINNFLNEKVFCDTLIKFGKKNIKKYKKLLLIAGGDNYMSLIIENKEKLEKYYVIPYIDEKLKNKLENKASFYKICEKYNIDYPATYVCKLGSDKLSKNINYPVAVKAADSVTYALCDFKNKKKSYKANDLEELKMIIKSMRDGNYKEDIIIQDFIPGDDSCMYVLNSYSNSKGKVKMMCLGNCVLEDYTPKGIGNYNAIISTYNKEIYETIEKFLNEIGYVGYSNFDFKYDYRDKKYKAFEINIRQGRSSYFTTAAGFNLAKYLVEDYVYEKDEKTVYNKNKFLWLAVPIGVLKKYTNNDSLKKVKELLSKKSYAYTLLYKKDFSFKRYLKIKYVYLKKYKEYKKYFNKRGIND